MLSNRAPVCIRAGLKVLCLSERHAVRVSLKTTCRLSTRRSWSVLGKLERSFFGKTNTSEFDWKGATSNPIFRETRNPWNLRYSPGRSSGGGAAGVASGLVPVAIGADGGGSLRIPAAFCGLVGFKPTLGRWPVWPASGAGPLSHIGLC